MPISPEQPGAVSPAGAQAYGALQQYERDRQFYLQQDAEIAKQQQAAAQVQLQQAQFVASQSPSERDVWAVNAQMAGEQQRYALDAQRMRQQAAIEKQRDQDKATQADSLRLQRLQQSKSAVREQIDNGTLTEDEGNSLMLQIQTGIDPLQQRVERSRMKHMEEQDKQMQQESARKDQLWNERQKFMSSTIKDRIQTVTLDDGTKVPFYVDEKGHPMPLDLSHQVQTQKLALETAKLRLDAMKQEIESGKKTGITPQLLEKIDKKAEDRYPDPILPKGSPADKVEAAWAEVDAKRAAYVASHVKGLKDTMGISDRPNATKANPDTVKPWPADPSLYTPDQKVMAEAVDTLAEKARSSPMPTSMMATTLKDIALIRGLLSQYGSETNMPPRLKQQYDLLLKKVQESLLSDGRTPAERAADAEGRRTVERYRGLGGGAGSGVVPR